MPGGEGWIEPVEERNSEFAGAMDFSEACQFPVPLPDEIRRRRIATDGRAHLLKANWQVAETIRCQIDEFRFAVQGLHSFQHVAGRYGAHVAK